MIFEQPKPTPRYESPIYLGDLSSRKSWAERKPEIEIEVVRDGNRVKRRGILNRANGETVFIGVFCYHVGEILHYRRIGA